jgi:hypothetical protein
MTFEKPYFFVPATKLKKLKTLIAEKNLEVIIDFEDAIAGVEIQPLLELKPQDVNWNKIWCRIPINNEITRNFYSQYMITINYISFSFILMYLKHFSCPSVVKVSMLEFDAIHGDPNEK